VRADLAELTLANLLPLLGDGAEERDLGGSVEYAVYLPEGELPPPRPSARSAARACWARSPSPSRATGERSYLEHLQTGARRAR
jgi:hypothetical protein